MNVLLQKHGAKHIYKVPEGLRELCTDIAREVLRSQPRNIYCFIADYVEALLITRENTKVAVKVVNNILSESQTVVDILHRSGLSLQQIARAAPRIQTAFRAYLDSVDMRAAQVYDDATCDERSKVSLESILRASGVSLEQAEKYATIIQAAFRGHYERMLLNESRGMIQWQRAATRTLEILRKAGASRAEASKAAILIQATYRGYYTRKNLKMKMAAALPPEKEISEADMIEPKEITQAVAWLDTTYKDLKLMPITANKAASIIQKAYRQYRLKKSGVIPWIKLERSMMEEERSMAVLKNLHQKVFNEVITRADIPVEFGSREDLTKAGTSTEELQHTSRDRLTRARIMKEDEYDEEALARIEKPDELLEKLIDESMYTIDMLENWKKDRENKKDLERDEKTKHT